MIRSSALAAVFVLSTALPTLAEAWSLVPAGTQFQRIGDRDTFVSVVRRGTLNRFGIRLQVTPDGRIEGNAFGRDVTGAWQWRDGFFCRELFWGAREVGANCQEVTMSGDTLRFTSDRGEGDYADLRLR